jgi:hypothetical protein
LAATTFYVILKNNLTDLASSLACNAGRQLLSSTDQVEADTNWHTHTCVLGFSVMGIWPRDADGTDINALQALPSRSLVVTADDLGGVNLLTYPCVVKNAPRRRCVRCLAAVQMTRIAH